MSFYTSSCTYNGITFSGDAADILSQVAETETFDDSLKIVDSIFFKKMKKKNRGDYGQK
ncbi:hypothetical protein [Streptococcus sp. E17BB]|uniref:hypothetical protein n=1 Tax=Streptococcus sp. E17BB TaxID=3278714 RepID=UPI00359CE10E